MVLVTRVQVVAVRNNMFELPMTKRTSKLRLPKVFLAQTTQKFVSKAGGAEIISKMYSAHS